ncbi:hemolymph clottable protein [Procambarus clarkii]|uniref:hemolymph clottable protein n=1 Tax=Procambarus clarkii TaxID=6728 RepID=UPI001E676A70|nr:hemolymph clottable protein-like [Procambarus clarkii]
MKGVILLTLLGGCWAVYPNLEYKYKYSGRIASGIPSLKDQYSGAGIQADVTIQISSDLKTFFKLSNTEVGEYHDELECDSRAPLPIEYRPLVEGKGLLEKPFEVHTGQRLGEEYVKLPQEPAWITNIKKALIRVFGVPPLLGHTGGRVNAFKQTTFSVNETMIHGDCLSWYSMIHLNKEQAAQEDRLREAAMEEDVQRDQEDFESYTALKDPSKSSKSHSSKTSKTTGTKTTGSQTGPAKLSVPDRIDNTLWRMTRTVDFDSCENLVQWKIHGNKKTDSYIERTSVGTYLLRGDQTDVRIEYALIEGSISVFTGQLSSEHISTFTNLTLELRAVRRIQKLFTIDYESQKHRSLNYQVDLLSYTSEGPHRKVHRSVEEKITGIVFTTERITEIKNLIISRIDEIAIRLTTRPFSNDLLVSDMSLLVEAASVLSRPEIDEVYSKIDPDDLYIRKIDIFFEVLITAGTEPAVRFLLDKFREPEFKKDHFEVMHSFLDSFATSVKDAQLISELIDLEQSLTWDEDDQLLKISALGNLASLAKQLCLFSDKWESFGNYACDPQYTCSPDIVFDNFLPALIQGVQDEESPVWRRLVYIQALANLGAPQIINILKHFVLGDKERSLVLRMNAILSLTTVYLQKAAHNEVFSLLMPVFENTGEHYEIRMTAFLAMSTYEPSLTWWERMAVSTWHDPSSQVANYVSSTITSLANAKYPSSRNAALVVPLTKPPAHLSLMHSAMSYLNDYLYNCKSKTRLSFGWLSSVKGVFPSKLLLHLQINTLLGFTREIRAIIHEEGVNNFMRTIAVRLNGTIQSSEIEIVQEMFTEIMEQLDFIYHEEPSDIRFYAKYRDSISLYLHQSNSYLNSLVASSVPNMKRDVEYIEVLPTDLGLPFMIQYTEQNALWIEQTDADMKLISGVLQYNSYLTIDYSEDNTLETKTLLPWSQKSAVGAGLHNAFSLVLPFHIPFGDLPENMILLYFEPLHNSTVQLLNSHNYPFTVMTGPFPTAVHTQHSEYKKISAVPLENFVQRRGHALPSLIGLSVETYWSADFPHPTTIFSDDVDPFTPAYKSWNYSLVWDPMTSTTKTINLTFTHVKLEKSEDEVQGENLEQFDQETQGVADNVDFSQTSNSGDLQFQFGQEETEAFGQQPGTQSRQRILKLQEEFMPVTGGIVQSISVGVELDGSLARSYEVIVTWAVSKSTSQISTKVQLSLIKNPSAGTFEEPHMTCFNVQVLKPRFLPLATVEEVLSANLQSSIEAEIYDGVSCSSTPVLEVQGTLDVSDEVIRRLREEVAKDCDLADSNLLTIDVITSPLYDHAHFTAKWTEDYPVFLKNLSYRIDDIIQHALFPLTSYDHTATNPQHTIDIDATKCLNSNKWTVRVVRPQMVAITKELSPPAILQEFIGPAEIRQIFSYNFIHGRTSFTCVVETTKVRTHDGVEFPYHPDRCWTTLSVGLPEKNMGENKTEAVLMARYTDQWEVRFVWKWAGYLYEITKSQLQVNGEPYEAGNELITFIEQEDASLSIINYIGIIIKISDKIEVIHSNNALRGVDGLCGRMDGERTGDLVGPQGCIYTDPKLFALAWTTKGDGCAQFSLRAKKRAVENFQEVCPRESHVPTSVSHPNVVYDCTEWQYIERFTGGYSCKATVPTPACKETCKEAGSTMKLIQYDCQLFQEIRNTTTQQECYQHAMVTTFPASCVP